jgi:hypothetical protein
VVEHSWKFLIVKLYTVWSYYMLSNTYWIKIVFLLYYSVSFSLFKGMNFWTKV